MTEHQYDGQGIADALKEAFPVPQVARPQYRSALRDVDRAILQTRVAGMGDTPERARIYGILERAAPLPSGLTTMTDEEMAVARQKGGMFFRQDGSLTATGEYQLAAILNNRG